MIKYGIVTTRFDLWFRIAQQFVKDNFAAPVFWLDTRLMDKEFKEVFPDCLSVSLLDYNNWCKGFFEVNHLYSTSEVEIPGNWSEVKDVVKLMFNRYNALGEWRNVDMDASLMAILVNLSRIWPTSKIDYFIFTETPHTPVDYLIYKLCKLKNIPTLMLQQHNIVPVVMFKFDIDGKPIKLQKNLFNVGLVNIFNKKIDQYFLDYQLNDQFIPDYIIQETYEIDHRRLSYAFNRFFLLSKEVWGNLTGKRTSRSVYSGLKVHKPRFGDPFFAQFKRRRFRKKLRNSFLNKFDNEFPKENYAFFPLHYEPERTTVPDGGKYYDQLKALVALRQKLDSHIPILVKEHFVTFSNALEGQTGRSPYFYDVIKALPNTFLIDYRLNTQNLIKNSLFVISITGTVLYQSVAMGKPAVIFGHSWFENAPGIFRIENLSEVDFEKTSIDPEKIVTYFKNQIINYSIPGVAHGSSLWSLKKHLGDLYSLDYEAEILSKTLKEILFKK